MNQKLVKEILLLRHLANYLDIYWLDPAWKGKGKETLEVMKDSIKKLEEEISLLDE